MTMASLEAYAAVVNKLPVKRARIYGTMERYRATGLTIQETCKVTGWQYNTVSARIYELAEAGLIKPRGDTRGGQTVWVPAAPEEVDALRQARRAAKPYETGIVGFHGVGGPEDYGPAQMIRVEVDVPRAIWEKMKKRPTRVRFL